VVKTNKHQAWEPGCRSSLQGL